MLDSSKMIQWLVISSIIFLIAVLSWHFGFFEYLIENDKTKISLFILILFTIASTITGIQTTKINHNENVVDNLWFTSYALANIGMIGTVIGFLIMLSYSFKDIDIQDIENVQEAIKNMSLGMGTALLTTFVGLTSCLMLQVQLLVFNRKDKK